VDETLAWLVPRIPPSGRRVASVRIQDEVRYRGVAVEGLFSAWPSRKIQISTDALLLTSFPHVTVAHEACHAADDGLRVSREHADELHPNAWEVNVYGEAQARSELLADVCARGPEALYFLDQADRECGGVNVDWIAAARLTLRTIYASWTAPPPVTASAESWASRPWAHGGVELRSVRARALPDGWVALTRCAEPVLDLGAIQPRTGRYRPGAAGHPLRDGSECRADDAGLALADDGGTLSVFAPYGAPALVLALSQDGAQHPVQGTCGATGPVVRSEGEVWLFDLSDGGLAWTRVAL